LGLLAVGPFEVDGFAGANPVEQLGRIALEYVGLFLLCPLTADALDGSFDLGEVSVRYLVVRKKYALALHGASL